MAANERAFRKEIQEAMRGVAFVQPISQKFLAGMPDLLVCWLGDVWLLELKYQDETSTAPLIRLSDLQRAWLTRYQAASGNAAWVVCSPCDGGWSMFAGLDPKQRRVTEFDLVETRRRGVSWDVQRLLDFLNLKREERGGSVQ